MLWRLYEVAKFGIYSGIMLLVIILAIILKLFYVKKINLTLQLLLLVLQEENDHSYILLTEIPLIMLV